MKSGLISRVAFAALLIGGLAHTAEAQGKSKGAEKKNEKAVAKTIKAEEKRDEKADKAIRKHVTSSQAVVVTRDVLIANGYQVVNVVPSGATQVVYYRRGNRGNGRGLGPVEKLYVVPAGDIVRFQSVPDPLLATILRRLGL